MKTKIFNLSGLIVISFIVLTILLTTSCSNQGGNSAKLQAKVDSLQNDLKQLSDEKALALANMKRYDTLDMNAFNNHDFKLLKHFYAPDVVVNMNNGSQKKGYDEMEKDWKEFFDNWPDMKSEKEVLNIGSGDWTAAIDHVTGTFTKPMKMNGKTFQPNGKKVSMDFVTFARWKDGKVVEEYDFGNDELMMRQLGLE